MCVSCRFGELCFHVLLFDVNVFFFSFFARVFSLQLIIKPEVTPN